jgi:hypothetical protein
MASTATIILSNYDKFLSPDYEPLTSQTDFVNSELKEYFKTIISYAERNKNIVLFELNEIARKDKPHFLAISGFENIFNQTSSSSFYYAQ